MTGTSFAAALFQKPLRTSIKEIDPDMLHTAIRAALKNSDSRATGQLSERFKLLSLEDGKVTIQVLLDRPMIEICLNNGESYTTEDRAKRGAVESVSAFAVGGPARLNSLEVHELKSIWKK